jgi:DNA-binding IclR family transcriptional regulator
MNTAERVVAVLDELASAGQQYEVSEISLKVGIGRKSAFRILSALENRGWLEQDSKTKKYSLTGAMSEVAFRALSQLDIQKISLPYLQELQAVTGETSVLSIRVDLERMFVGCVPTRHEIRHFIPVGRRLKLWYGSGGKSILAFMAEDEIETVLSQFQNSDVWTLAGVKAVPAESIRKELAEIRKQGFAVGVGERTSAVCGVAAPIFNHNQTVMGAIGISGPMPRFDKDQAFQYGELVGEKAQKISLVLGVRAK